MNKGDPTVEGHYSSKESDFRVADGLRSDKPPSLVALARSVKALSPFVSDFVTFHLVLDANKAQHELRWRLGSRKNVFAWTRLYEAIVSGVFVAYSPTYIGTEIFAHEEEIAFDTDSTVEDVRKEWSELLPHLHLYEPGNEPLNVKRIIDEKDLPYAAVRSELGVRAIYTDDPDLMLMEQPVVMDRTIDLHLRDYARSSTVKIGISLGSGVAFAMSIEMVPVLYGILKGTISWIRRQPTFIQLAIVGTVVALAIHPKSRAGFSKAWGAVAISLNGRQLCLDGRP